MEISGLSASIYIIIYIIYIYIYIYIYICIYVYPILEFFFSSRNYKTLDFMFFNCYCRSPSLMKIFTPL